MNAVTGLDRAFVVEDFQPVRKNALRGFARIALPSGMILADVSIHVDGDRAWAMPASKPMLDRAGAVMRDAAGKVRYAPIVSFASKALRDRFSDAVIDAMRAAHPDAFQ